MARITVNTAGVYSLATGKTNQNAIDALGKLEDFLPADDLLKLCKATIKCYYKAYYGIVELHPCLVGKKLVVDGAEQNTLRCSIDYLTIEDYGTTWALTVAEL